MRWLATLAACLLVGPAFALGLGEVEGRAVIGRPLHLTVPILGLAGDAAEAACATLIADGDAEGLSGIRIKVAGDRVHLLTSRMLTQPILQFRLRVGCAGPFERSFLVLPEPAGSIEQPAKVSEAVAASHAPAPAKAAESVSLPQAAPPAAPRRSIVLMSSTSLRMLSRQRYPGDPDTRVSFIRQMAAANPDLFPSEAAAFDQRIAAGTRLMVPASVPAPQRRDAVPAGAAGTVPAASRASAAGAARPADRSGTGRDAAPGRGRLIIGAEGQSRGKGPGVAELNDTVDRLIEVMNQQVTVQIGLTERIKGAEAELAELKRQVQAEKLRVAQIDAELKAVREAAERTGTIQLVLLVLLGGVAGAWLLNWLSHRRRAGGALPPLAAADAPVASSSVAPGRVQPMPSVFDELRDPLDDILTLPGRDSAVPPGRQ